MRALWPLLLGSSLVDALPLERARTLSIRQHTSACVSIPSPDVSIRPLLRGSSNRADAQSAINNASIESNGSKLSIRQHASACVSIPSVDVSMRQHEDALPAERLEKKPLYRKKEKIEKMQQIRGRRSGEGGQLGGGGGVTLCGAQGGGSEEGEACIGGVGREGVAADVMLVQVSLLTYPDAC